MPGITQVVSSLPPACAQGLHAAMTCTLSLPCKHLEYVQAHAGAVGESRGECVAWGSVHSGVHDSSVYVMCLWVCPACSSCLERPSSPLSPDYAYLSLETQWDSVTSACSLPWLLRQGQFASSVFPGVVLRG